VRLDAAGRHSLDHGGEGVVEDIAGPNDEGTGWTVTVRLGGEASGDTLVALPEAALEPTGLAVDERGRRVPLATLPRPDEPRDRIELRLFTDLVDGIEAARAAEEIEQELLASLSGATVTIVAERHWSEPYSYEFTVTVEPAGEGVEALGWLALLGDGGWISSRDDGWRFDLWWDAGSADAIFLSAEVHGAQVAFLPWHSPRRRPEQARPLLAVSLRAGLGEPGEDNDDLDAQPGDEEA
jgi:hypothetical protein